MKRIILGIVIGLFGILFATCGKNPADKGKEFACDHVDADGMLVEIVDSVVATQWLGTVTGGFTLAEGDVIDSVDVVFLDLDSLRVGDAAFCDKTLKWEIVDTTVVRISLMPGKAWSVKLEGLHAGSTTVRFRVWHVDHSDFTSQPIAVSVASSGPPHTPISATAASLDYNCSILSSWNYDPVNGAGKVFGAIVVESGKTLEPVTVSWLDTLKNAIAVRYAIDPTDPKYSLDWTVADTSIAKVSLVSGERWRVNVSGIATGKTSVIFRLRFNATTELTTGSFPIIVRAAISGAEPANFMITKGGVWHVVCQHNTLIAPNYCINTVSGKFSLANGELTDLYSFWFPNPTDSCKRVSPSTSQYYLVFEFADPCIARAIYHPIHWDEIMLFHIEGLSVGQTTVRIHVVRSIDQTVAFTSPPIDVEITS